MNKLEEFLRNEAMKVTDDADDWCGYVSNYSEHVNPDAINGQAWLDNRTSYIWKVATLAVVDGNKADWVTLFVGHQRTDVASPEFIGRLTWPGGENDDVGRCLRRYIQTLETGREHPVFHPD